MSSKKFRDLISKMPLNRQEKIQARATEMKGEYDEDALERYLSSLPPWIEFQSAVDFIKQILDDPNWSWGKNMDCKYVSLRVDMRDGKVLLQNRNGKGIRIEDVKYQYKRE